MDIKDRLKLVLEEVFKNDIDALAEAMGVHRTTLFRYKNGGDTPSTRARKLLQERNAVSGDWVLNGGSDAIVIEPISSNASDCNLPIYRAPITVMSNDSMIKHSGMSQSTAPLYVASNRYWLQFEKRKGVFDTGDLVLIETCEMRQAKKSDVGRKYFVLKRPSGVVFDKIIEADYKGTPPAKVCGIAILMQRSFELGVDPITGD